MTASWAKPRQMVTSRCIARLTTTRSNPAASIRSAKENLVVTAVHELDVTDPRLALDDEEREMVDAEISDLAEWLGVPVARPR